jgi:hypothetical protein
MPIHDLTAVASAIDTSLNHSPLFPLLLPFLSPLSL